MEGGSVGVAVPAAGAGRRMGGAKKAFLRLAGEPLLVHALRPFLTHSGIDALAVALPPEDADDPPGWLVELDSRIRIVAGGRTRMQSVYRALRALPEELDVVIVHDAARPLVSGDLIDRCVAGARDGEGTVAGWPSTDTLKEVDGTGRVLSTPPRSTLWRAQTPQAFPRRALLHAYREAVTHEVEATDDAAVFARAGGTVRMVQGGAWNLKVTHPDDLAVAELFLARGRDAGGEG